MNDLITLSRAREATRSGNAKALRECASLSQAEVARAVEVSPSAVCRWESGERLPHGRAGLRYGRLLARLAAELAISEPP